MRRRAFTAGALALTTAPATAWAQPAPKTRRIAIASTNLPVQQLTEVGGAPWRAAFYRELRRHGYAEGQNLIVNLWSGGGRADRDEFAREIVASAPEVIFTGEAAGLGPYLLGQTKTIPVVFFGQDPIRIGLVSNIARPGGNMTGVTVDPGGEIVTKHFQLLCEAVPAARRLAYLNIAAIGERDMPFLEKAAAAFKVAFVPIWLDLPASGAAYRAAFAKIAALPADALLVGSSNENNTYPNLIVELAAAGRLPTIHDFPEFARAGGLMNYSANYVALFTIAASYVARILNGEKPGDLPVQQATTFDFIVNLKTARAFGVTLPESIMIRATEVIE
jgi:putative tryptophan/tyrosine transport system substrate-binding protein